MELIPVNFHGVYYYRVAGSVLFVNKVIGPWLTEPPQQPALDAVNYGIDVLGFGVPPAD